MAKKGVDYETFRRMMLALPGMTEATAYGTPIFKVKNKMAARVSEEFADTIVVKIDPALRASLLDAATNAFYITPHYAAHPLILVRLAKITEEDLQYLVEQAWRMIAPKRALAAFDEVKSKS